MIQPPPDDKIASRKIEGKEQRQTQSSRLQVSPHAMRQN